MASCWFASEVQFAVCKLRLAMSLVVIVASLAYRRNHEDCRIQKIDLQFASRDIIEETHSTQGILIQNQRGIPQLQTGVELL